MAITSGSTLPPGVLQSLSMTILSTPTSSYIYSVAAKKESLPRNAGRIERFLTYDALQSFTVPLGSDGNDGASQQLTNQQLDIQIDKYGTWVDLAEETLLQNQDSVLNQTALRLGQALRQTEDELISAMISSSASRIAAVNGNNGDVPTEITALDSDEVTTALLNANGHMFTDMIEGSDQISTAAVQPSYIAMTNTQISPDLRRMDDWINIANYPYHQKPLNGEWGTCQNSRFLISTISPVEASSSAMGNDVFDVVYSAKEGYLSIDQEGGDAEFIYHGPEYGGPLETRVTCGSKFYWGGGIANDAWVAILEVTKA